MEKWEIYICNIGSKLEESMCGQKKKKRGGWVWLVSLPATSVEECEDIKWRISVKVEKGVWFFFLKLFLFMGLVH